MDLIVADGTHYFWVVVIRETDACSRGLSVVPTLLGIVRQLRSQVRKYELSEEHSKSRL